MKEQLRYMEKLVMEWR